MRPSASIAHALTIILSFSAAVLGLSSQNHQVYGGDWPQILGPHRDGQAIDEQPIATNWIASPPRQLWERSGKAGYSGAAISGGRAYLFNRDEDEECITAVDLRNGHTVFWETKWPATYRSSMNPDSGPRAVPTVYRDRVLCYGAAGDLVSVDSATGKIMWQRALRKELFADDGYFGAASSPIVIDGVIVANIGGKKGGIVGLDAKTGATLWQATDYDASYASPIAVEIGGKAAALVVTRLRTVLIEAASGTIIGEIDFGARGPTVNAATPLPVGNERFLLTASYGIGAHLIAFQEGKLQRSWKDVNLLAGQYNSPVLIDSVAVGVNGREDLGEVQLRAIDLNGPRVLWEEPLPGPTHLIAVGNQLLQVTIDGELRVGRISAKGIDNEAKFRLRNAERGAPHLYRALPAFSNHVLILRANITATTSNFIAYELP